MVALAEQCPRLASVDFGRCYNLTDVSVAALAKQCPLLDSIDFARCYNLTDAVVVTLAERCPLLVSVVFFGCKHVKLNLGAARAQLEVQRLELGTGH